MKKKLRGIEFNQYLFFVAKNQKERIINMKIDRFNVVELKDGNRATIIDVRGKK